MFHYEKEDSRIQHTKQYIYEALVKLLDKNNYEDITTSMIIEKSGIGRTTYYRHFYNKDDIILYKLKDETQNILNLINENYDLSVYNKDILEKVKFFFSYWNDHPEVIDLIIKIDKVQLLLSFWPNYLIEMFSSANISIPSDNSELYTAHFAIGGLTLLLIEWFKNNRKESIDFISKHFNIPQ